MHIEYMSIRDSVQDQALDYGVRLRHAPKVRSGNCVAPSNYDREFSDDNGAHNFELPVDAMLAIKFVDPE